VLSRALTDDPAKEVREVAADVLGQYGSKASSAAEALTRALKDKEAGVRRRAIVTLGKIGPEGRQGVPALREIVKSESDKQVVTYAIRTLGALGKEARDAVPELVAKCRVEVSLEVRLAAIEELGHIGTDAKEAIPALTIATKDGRTDVREAATEALKRIQGMP
jgi:HEAT repeat protein